jgi:hypothetical protein
MCDDMQGVQCVVVQRAQHRQWFNLTGRNAEIQLWTADPRALVLPAHFPRRYAANSLSPAEAWVAQILEPIRVRAFPTLAWSVAAGAGGDGAAMALLGSVAEEAGATVVRISRVR